MKKVAVIGTQGVPAQYGGFESLVENLIGQNCAEDIKYTVFCSAPDMRGHNCKEYKGASLKYIGLHANGIQSIPYDILSMLRCISGYNVILVLGVSGCIFLPILKCLSRSRIIVNIDGLEHKRGKWGKFARRFLRLSEYCAVRHSDIIVSDNAAIKEYVRSTYGVNSEMIAYGGDNVLRNILIDRKVEVLRKYGIAEKEYAITVCRIEPENNCHLILKSFAKSGKRLLFIGNWSRSNYGRGLKNEFIRYANITLSDPVYDLDMLYVLRSNASCYVHGHSAGGTNPSLVEAMFFGIPILAFDVPYNRATTGGLADYWKDSEELEGLIGTCSTASANSLKEYAFTHYRWNHIAKQYEELYSKHI